jgi:tryptophanyl-tRNA synthetase
MDLSIPQYGIRQYDWIISLEVAEHIPKKYEAVYLDNIFRHA